MDLRSIYISNGIGIVLLIVLAYVSRTKVQRRHAEDKLYTLMIFGVMLACCMEAVSYAIDGKLFPGARIINYIANTYLFSVNLFMPLCVLIYMDLGLYGDKSRIWREYKIHIIIWLVMFGVTIFNFFVPVSYYITPENVYERRPVSYVYYVFIAYYIISAIAMTHRYEREYGTRSFFSIELFLVPILIGTTLQFVFYGLSLAWLSSAVGLVGLYMMQQNETAYLDPLTELYNRQYMNNIVAYWKRKGYRFSGIMVDMDRFKRINDTYGHSEGDDALVNVAGLLKSVFGKGSFVFRFAGDEFIILIRTDDESMLKRKEAELEKAVRIYNRDSNKPYAIGLSYGHGSYDNTDGDIDKLMKKMDENMYEMKKRHHERESA